MVNDRSIYQSHGWYGHPGIPKRLTGKTGFLAPVPPMSSGKPGSAIGGRDFQAQPLGGHSADRSPGVHAEYRGARSDTPAGLVVIDSRSLVRMV